MHDFVLLNGLFKLLQQIVCSKQILLCRPMQFSKENSCSYLYVNNILAKYFWLRSVEITGHLEYISEQKWNNWSQSLSVFYCLSAKKE